MGQFIQDGARILFETVIELTKSTEEIVLEAEPVDLDGMNYLAGKTVDFVNKSAMKGTLSAPAIKTIFFSRNPSGFSWIPFSASESPPYLS